MGPRRRVLPASDRLPRCNRWHGMNLLMASLAHPWGPAHGGTLRTRAIAEAAASHGHRVTVIAPATPGASSPEAVRMLTISGTFVGEQPMPSRLRHLKQDLLP